jgi:hypothetical protein
MCTDVEAFVRSMSERGIDCTPIQNQGWGMLTSITLPGGGKLGVYQPRHARPPAMTLSTPKQGTPKKGKTKTSKPAAKAKPATKAKAAPNGKGKPKPVAKASAKTSPKKSKR